MPTQQYPLRRNCWQYEKSRLSAPVTMSTISSSTSLGSDRLIMSISMWNIPKIQRPGRAGQPTLLFAYPMFVIISSNRYNCGLAKKTCPDVFHDKLNFLFNPAYAVVGQVLSQSEAIHGIPTPFWRKLENAVWTLSDRAWMFTKCPQHCTNHPMQCQNPNSSCKTKHFRFFCRFW